MKKLILFLTIFLSSVTNSFAQSTILKKEANLNETDKVLLANTIKLMVDDWGQTLDIQNHHNRYETNQLIGKRPHSDKVNAYFTACVGLTALATSKIENVYVRRAVFVGVMVLEGMMIQKNTRLGLHNELGEKNKPVVVSMVFPF